jgi:dihydroflavonol-4-reductase
MEPNPSFWAGQRVCVTGGSGFLGYHLVRQLLGLGARVTVLALPPRQGHPLLKEKVIRVFGDIRNAEVVRRATADCEVILHTAGVVATWGPALEHMHAIHVAGTRQVLECAPARALVVHTSSIVAVGASSARQPLHEASAFNLEQCKVDYVQAKRAAEQVALAAAARGRHVVVTNPGYLIGPEDHEPSVMGRFCVRFWKGRLPLAPSGGFNLVDVRDVARGHLLAAEHGRPGRRYILGGENRTVRSFMAKLAQVAALRPRSLPKVPWWALHVLAGLSEGRAWFTHKEPYPSFQHVRLNRYHWFCRSDRACRELGYRTCPLTLTLSDTYRWYVAQGELSLRGFNRWWMRPAAAAA